MSLEAEPGIFQKILTDSPLLTDTQFPASLEQLRASIQSL